MNMNSDEDDDSASEGEGVAPAVPAAPASPPTLLSIKFEQGSLLALNTSSSISFDADVMRGSVRLGTTSNPGYFAFRADTPPFKPSQEVARRKRHFIALDDALDLPPQYTLSAWVHFPLEEHPWQPRAPNKGAWRGTSLTQHRFKFHVVAYGVSNEYDNYHLMFRELEGEERLVGINDGNAAGDFFVPFKQSDGSAKPLDPAEGWHLLTLVSDVAQKSSTLYVDGKKFGTAVGASDAPITSFGCNAYPPDERERSPAKGEFQVTIGCISTIDVVAGAAKAADVKRAFQASHKPLDVDPARERLYSVAGGLAGSLPAVSPAAPDAAPSRKRKAPADRSQPPPRVQPAAQPTAQPTAQPPAQPPAQRRRGGAAARSSAAAGVSQSYPSAAVYSVVKGLSAPYRGAWDARKLEKFAMSLDSTW